MFSLEAQDIFTFDEVKLIYYLFFPHHLCS